MRLALSLAGLAAGLALLVTACGSTNENRVLPADPQYASAVRLYEDGEYDDAVAAFQAFTFNYPQDPRVVDARWLTAESYYSDGDWATAAQEYLNFQRDYPRDDRAAEALFNAARSYERMSLRPELDQRDTQRALTVIDRVLSEYPGSEFAESARERRGQLRNKLAEKEYLIAEFYFDNEDYEAAETYLVELIERFPQSDWVPAAYALLARARCEHGLDDEAARAFRALAELYPESRATRDVRGELSRACRGEASPGEGGGG